MASDNPDPRWEAFAAREPYFAVLTARKFLRAHLTPQTEREFFGSGEALVDYMFRLIEERLAPDFAPSSILEYGCGIGRLAIPLARRAARRGGAVVAVDRSPAMLGLARQEAARRGMDNVTCQTSADFRASSKTFDCITAYLVLQRMPQDEGLNVVRGLAARLAPGGVAILLVPYRSTARPAVRIARWLRHRVPLVNGLVNRFRGRSPAEPFLPTYTYDLSRLVGTIQEECIGTMNVLLEPQEGLDTALLFIEAPMTDSRSTATSTSPDSPAADPKPDTVVNVASLVASASIDELNRAAEDYFASLTDREHHLTKPFSQAHEAPVLLASMAAVLQGLTLAPGTTVLEFGAGTGWLSRDLRSWAAG